MEMSPLDRQNEYISQNGREEGKIYFYRNKMKVGVFKSSH